MNTSKSFRNGLILKDKGKFKKNLIINKGGKTKFLHFGLFKRYT